MIKYGKLDRDKQLYVVMAIMPPFIQPVFGNYAGTHKKANTAE
jgi:hypothetical protein